MMNPTLTDLLFQLQPTSKPKQDIMSVLTGGGEELDRLRKVLVEAIDEENNRTQRERKFYLCILRW